MEKQTIEAVFERGTFRPLAPLRPSPSEGQHVRIIVEAEGTDSPLDLALRVYEGLSDRQVEEIEQIALDRSHFFDEGAAE